MDLYNIPNDTGHPWRLNKFVEYQHYALAVDPPMYCKYAQIHGLTPKECITLAWFHSVTYCEITAIYLFETIDISQVTPKELKKFWKENKENLIFGSARMHAKNMDWFYPLMSQFLFKTKQKPYAWLKKLVKMDENLTPNERYQLLNKELKTWKFMGRFSIDLFVEALIALYMHGLIPISLEEDPYTWKNCSNLTSGMLNIFYKDKAANDFDKTGKISRKMEAFLNEKIVEVQKAVQKAYPEQDVSFVSVINKVCSFRNLFKGTRYGGFHHDRQLGNLYHYMEAYPNKEKLWGELMDIRSELFYSHLLGELGGRWTGIRKDRKKLFLREGLTGVEAEAVGKHKRV